MTRPREVRCEDSGEGVREDRLVSLLRDRGAYPIHLPTTAIVPTDDPGPLERAVAAMDAYDWLIVSSRRAVPPLEKALRAAGLSPDEVRDRGLRVCAVGPRTAEALAELGLPPEIVPEAFVAESLVAAFLDSVGSADAEVGGIRALFPRAREGRDVIPEALRARGIVIDVVTAYGTVECREEANELARLVEARGVDLLTFTAGSTARSFGRAWQRRAASTGLSAWPRGIGVVGIGPATAEAAREVGLPVDAVAHPHTLEGLVSAVENWARSG